MKKLLLCLCCVMVAAMGHAQGKFSIGVMSMLQSVDAQIAEAKSNANYAKGAMQECPVDTAEIQSEMVVHFNADGTVKSMDIIAELADDATCPTTQLEKEGINVTGEALGFVFLHVPAEKLDYLNTISEFTSYYENRVNKPLNDGSRNRVGVSVVNGIDDDIAEDIYHGPYTGKGVIVGVIDGGMDYNHAAFKDADGKSRVVKVVDYRLGTKNVFVTESSIAALTSDIDKSSVDMDKSHGTHVAATVAGSNLVVTQANGAERNLMGMAPDANIILCGLPSLLSNHVIESIDEIKKTANEMGLPFVINYSAGSTEKFWHNGNNPISKAVKEKLVGEGAIFCKAIGNDAIYKNTVDRTLKKGETLMVVFNKDAQALIPKYKYNVMTNSPSVTALTSTYSVVDITTGEESTTTQNPLLNTSGEKVSTPSFGLTRDSSVGYCYGSVEFSGDRKFADANKYLVFKLTANEDVRVYMMATTKSKDPNNPFGCLYNEDIPGFTYDKGTADMSFDNDATKDMITVGAYCRSRNFYSYIDNKTYGYGPAAVGNPNSTAAFSSYGVDDFGNTYPDVVAPGVAVISAFNRWDKDVFNPTGATGCTPKTQTTTAVYKVGNVNCWYGSMNGTSMASPMVAGIIALWLQADPTLTTEKIREIINATSHKSVVSNSGIDTPITITSGNPIQLGAGLIDAYAGLKYIESQTGIEINGVKEKNQRMGVIKYLTPSGNLIIENAGKMVNAAGSLLQP